MEDLRMVFRNAGVDTRALRGLTFSVDRGEFVAIMGPSGCGKSTLLHVMGGLLRPSSGRIWIDGIDIAAVSDAERTEIRRQKIGFVFQRFNLLPTLTAHDNIDLAARLRSNGHFKPGQAADLLHLLGLEGKLHSKPRELSGGEQQRVALARALVNHPPLLLADEPTGNLDSQNSKMVLDKMRDINQRFGQTIVMITHDAEAASAADRILYMRDGQIVQRPQDFLHIVSPADSSR